MNKFFHHLTRALLAVTSLLAMTSLADRHVGEVRIYVDPEAARKWVRTTGQDKQWQFWREMNSTFYEVNQILQTMETNGVDLQLQIEDIVFLNQDVLKTRSGQKIVNSESLVQFEDWLSPTYSNNQYDLAILYTGYNLVKSMSTDGSAGYAYVGTICSAKALGVIELEATYMDALLTAHEIGHILGAYHDGHSERAPNCGSTSGHIMNAVTSHKSRNHFYFSSCSAYSIKKVLQELKNDNKNCMGRWYYSKNISGPRYGTLTTPDEYCKRKFGSGSYVSRQTYGSYGDEVCTRMACMTKAVGTRFYWTFAVTPQGIICGKNKHCDQGRCVKMSSGGSADVSDRCPFGDQPKIEGDYQMTCSSLSPSQCSDWRNACCQTCNDPGTADEVCQRLEGKGSSMARRAYSSYGNNLCSKLACLTSVKGTYFSWNYHTAPDGMKCGTNKRCENGRCVRSNQGDATMSDTCPYGDQPWLAGDWQTTCGAYVRKNGCSGKGWEQTCCGSCRDPGTADEVCQKRLGKDSAMARRAYSSYGNNLCARLSCLKSTKGTTFFWNSQQAPDGMKCGKNKRCYDGKCLWTRTGDSSVSDSCPYGDQPWLGGSWQSTCSNYVRKNGCGGKGWTSICCASC